MSLISTDRGRVLVATEDLATYGQDAVDVLIKDPTKDVVYQPVRSRNIVNPERTLINPPRVTGGLTGSPHATVPNRCSITAEIGLTGLPVGQDTPDWHAWFLAANLQAVVVPTTSVTYVPSLYPDKSLTVYEFMDNLEDSKSRLRYATGVRGALTLQGALDDEIYASFDGVGLYQHPGKAAQYYDPYGSLSKEKNGSTGITSHTQTVTILDAEEDYVYRILVNGTTFTYTGLALDTAADIATALAALIDASGAVDVDAVASGPVITMVASAPGDRFFARLNRREAKMSVARRERYADLANIVVASQMTITMDKGTSTEEVVQCSGFALNMGTTAEEVRTITGPSGVERVINTRPLAERAELTLEILDGNEDVYGALIDGWQDGRRITLDIKGENASTEFEITMDYAQIVTPEASESGNFLGWTVTFALNGDGQDLNGGSDFRIVVTRKP
jgi:hypothetical protein